MSFIDTTDAVTAPVGAEATTTVAALASLGVTHSVAAAATRLNVAMELALASEMARATERARESGKINNNSVYMRLSFL